MTKEIVRERERARFYRSERDKQAEIIHIYIYIYICLKAVIGSHWTGAGLEDITRENKSGALVLSCLGCEGSWRADL